MNLEDVFGLSILAISIEIVVFFALFFILHFIFKRFHNSSNRFLNPLEFLPQDEIHTLRQVFYLILMACFFIDVLYMSIFIEQDIFYLALFDVAISLFAALLFYKPSLKNIVLIILLIPYGSLSYFLFGFSLMGILDFIHIPVFIYLIKLAYDNFMEYTHSNRLGYTIIILFTIIFVSFLVTQVVEHVNPLDSLVMVSNAFTSNGYSVLGRSIPGKINSIFLVWGGYIISGVGTASLTAAILIRRFNARVRELEKIIEEEVGDNDG